MRQVLLLVTLALVATIAITPVEAKVFSTEKYSLDYPNGCKIKKTDNRFSTADASLECKGDAGFLFESSDDASILTLGSTDEELVDSLETTMGNIHYGSDVVERSTDVGAKQYTVNNQSVPYVTGSYDQSFHTLFGGERTEEWGLMIALVKLQDGDYMLVQYRNNEEGFDKQLKLMEDILQSIQVKQVGAAPSTDTDTNTQDTYTNTNPYEDDICEDSINKLNEICGEES